MVQMIIKMMSKLATKAILHPETGSVTFGKKIPPGDNVHRKATFLSGRPPFNTKVGYWRGDGVKIFVVAKVRPFVPKISLVAI